MRKKGFNAPYFKSSVDKQKELFNIACPACPVAPGDGTGVAPADGTGVNNVPKVHVICLNRFGTNVPLYKKPRVGEVYNVGGGRHSNCSMLEAIELCENIAEKKINWAYNDINRSGDHIWWISDVTKFQNHYPDWGYRYNLMDILKELYSGLSSRL